MDIPDSLTQESLRAGAAIRKKEMVDEIGELKEDIDRAGSAVSRRLQQESAQPQED